MAYRGRCAGPRRGFSLLEVMVVVVVLGILAAVVVPRFGGVTAEARTAAAQAALGGVRSGIAAYRARAIMTNSDPYPTLAQLATVGTVLQSEIPASPYLASGAVQAVTEAQATARQVVGAAAGWNYFVDNDASPPRAIFYLNSAAETTAAGADGQTLTANEL